jgi:hypothetical protein
MSALDAAVRLAEAVAEVKRTTHIIAMTVCPNDQVLPGVGGYGEPSHLRAYFECFKGQPRDYWTGVPTAEAVAEAADLFDAVRACPACSALYDAVQDRKAARRRRGNARAALARIGAAELKRRATLEVKDE